MKHKRNTEAVVAYAKRKKEETVEKVEQAIKQLIQQNEKINFNTVTKAAGVSKSYLYNQTELRDRIETLRQQQREVTSPKNIKKNMNVENKDSLIQVFRERIRELEKENKQLKEEIKRVNGKLYENF
jgi:predicted nuclease with TOPRIM domain